MWLAVLTDLNERKKAKLDGHEYTLAEVLDQAHAALTRYAVLGSPEEYDAVTLLAALTHCQRERDLQYAPRMQVTKPTFGMGASTLRKVLMQLVHRPIAAGAATPAAICDMMNEAPGDPPTLLLDEAHLSKSDNLRRILNLGYERKQPYVKMAGKERVDVATFGIVILTGIGRYLAEDTESRVIKISMQPARRHARGNRSLRGPAPQAVIGTDLRRARQRRTQAVAHPPAIHRTTRRIR